MSAGRKVLALILNGVSATSTGADLRLKDLLSLKLLSGLKYSLDSQVRLGFHKSQTLLKVGKEAVAVWLLDWLGTK